MRICPKCRAFFGDPQLAFCLADGTPLANVAPQSDKWNEGTRVIQEQAKRIGKQRRKLRWRRLSLGALTTLVTTMLVVTSFTVETTTSPPVVSLVPSPESSPTVTVTSTSLPSDSPSPSASPTPSISPTPTPTPIPVYNISGVVTTTGQPLAGVDIQLSGAKTDSTKTDPNGRYAFNDLPAGGNYTVMARHVQIVFASASHSFNPLSQNELADFPAAVFKISGRVTSLAGPMRRVKISLEGSKATWAETDDNGYYSFNDLRAGGSYTVIPRLARIQPPTSRDFDNLRRDESADFHQSDATPPPCSQSNEITALKSHEAEWQAQIEPEWDSIKNQYLPKDAKNLQVGLSKIDFQYAFPKPCQTAFIVASYSWHANFLLRGLSTGLGITRTRHFNCRKLSGAWSCP